jgi:hypothetical protein
MKAISLFPLIDKASSVCYIAALPVFGRLAQVVEQLTLKPLGGVSNPSFANLYLIEL